MFLFLAPSLGDQGQVNYLLVDGSGNTPGAYLRITDAAAVAVSGDVIVIQGLTDQTGNPVDYSETKYPPNVNAGENFPIHIPAGVRLAANVSGPAVHVWSTAALAPSALFVLDGSPTDDRTKTVHCLAIPAAPSAAASVSWPMDECNWYLDNQSAVGSCESYTNCEGVGDPPMYEKCCDHWHEPMNWKKALQDNGPTGKKKGVSVKKFYWAKDGYCDGPDCVYPPLYQEREGGHFEWNDSLLDC